MIASPTLFSARLGPGGVDADGASAGVTVDFVAADGPVFHEVLIGGFQGDPCTKETLFFIADMVHYGQRW